MMLERIIRKLGEIGCAQYELREKTVNTWEFYFIRHRLDQNRVVRVKSAEVKLFRPLEDGKMLGSASGEISPTASEEELDTALRNIWYQASLVRNPAYTLTGTPLPEIPSEPVDVKAISEGFLRAMRAVPETETERINSYEIFVREISESFRNSNGVAWSATYPESMIEVVVNASRGEHEIELYRSFSSGVCDEEKLTRDVSKALRFGKDRLLAGPTPKLGKSDVLFTTADAVSIYEYFTDRMAAGLRYRKLSDWKKGESIAPGSTGDRVTVFAAAKLDNSSRSCPVDEEGALIRERYLIRDGVAEESWGSRQMSEYLGEGDSSIVYNFVVSGGSEEAAALHSGDYLELVEFSDFQVDSVSGDLMGEIRLGYWHHGDSVEIITGGSVSGNMREAVRTMRFSSETEQYDTFVIPRETRLYGLTITGVE